MSKDLARESIMRTPLRGIRQKLRIALREAGVVGKFRTDHLRDGTLLVRGQIKQPFTHFNGLPVHYDCKVEDSQDQTLPA